jgi:hypothetical protein
MRGKCKSYFFPLLNKIQICAEGATRDMPSEARLALVLSTKPHVSSWEIKRFVAGKVRRKCLAVSGSPKEGEPSIKAERIFICEDKE